MNRFSIIKFIIFLALVLAACQPGAPHVQLLQAEVRRIESPDMAETYIKQVAAGNNAFALDLFDLVTAEKMGNLVFSPYSLTLAFSMVYAGAQGESEVQMARALHFLPQDQQHMALNAVDQQLQSLGEGEVKEEEGVPFRLRLANAVWGQRGYAFKQPFLETLAAHYGAGLRVVDFQKDPEAVREAINAWIADETERKIEEIALPGSISANTRLVLANAVYFKAGWY